MDSRFYQLMLASAAGKRRPFPTESLFQIFQSPEGIFKASDQDLKNIEGLHESTFQALVYARERHPCRKRLDWIAKQQIRILSYESSEYPENLRHIPDPPPVLFIKGNSRPRDNRSIAIIGSRKASAYGTAVCEMLVKELVKEGFAIISGMAKGIDAAAHWAALENRGRTVGVLGTGVDVVYPKANAPLFARIPGQGYLVSEFMPGTAARPENFPRRNRLISGLSWGVLVVEAAERSGTMITVRMALEQGREVFAVPGDIRLPLSRGTHRLIQQGAKLVEGVGNILEEFPDWLPSMDDPCRHAPNVPSHNYTGMKPEGDGFLCDTNATETLLQLLHDTGTGLDAMIRRTGWGMEKINTLLTQLELSGKVKRLPGNRYARI